MPAKQQLPYLETVEWVIRTIEVYPFDNCSPAIFITELTFFINPVKNMTKSKMSHLNKRCCLKKTHWFQVIKVRLSLSDVWLYVNIVTKYTSSRALWRRRLSRRFAPIVKNGRKRNRSCASKNINGYGRGNQERLQIWEDMGTVCTALLGFIFFGVQSFHKI